MSSKLNIANPSQNENRMNVVNESWTKFKGTVQGFDSARQLAAGVALGMMIGLIPKDSLLPYAIALIALLSHANLLCVGVSAFVFTKLSPSLDIASHPLGSWLLNLNALESSLNWIHQWPIVPWLRLDNTVVTGSFLMGILLTIPVYAISHLLFKRFGSTVFSYLIRTRVARWFVGQPSHHLQKS